MSVSVSKIDPPSPAAPSAPLSCPDENLFDDVDDALERIAEHCHAYRGGVLWRSIGQLALNLSLFTALIAGSYICLAYGAWYGSALLAFPAAGMLVRLFIIQHDCGHGAFFKNSKTNHAVGWALSLLSFTPYGFWRDAHNRHHANSGNLTRRGMGGVDTLTVEEFQRLSPFNKGLYKFYRHPVTLLLLGPPIYFIIIQRFPLAGPMPYSEVYHGMKGARIWKSVMLLNVMLFAFYGALSFFFGLAATLVIFIPIVALAGLIGTWLFYIQHQYEDTYWKENKQWDYTRAALFGSSHYALPPVLQWFTGNIGLHHIHHLSSLIPNYRLQACYDSSPDLQKLPKLTFTDSLKSARLALWDEARGRMVDFASVR